MNIQIAIPKIRTNNIHDEILTIEIFEMGHRREVYK